MYVAKFDDGSSVEASTLESVLSAIVLHEPNRVIALDEVLKPDPRLTEAQEVISQVNHIAELADGEQVTFYPWTYRSYEGPTVLSGYDPIRIASPHVNAGTIYEAVNRLSHIAPNGLLIEAVKWPNATWISIVEKDAGDE